MSSIENTLMALSDEELVTRVQQGEVDCFGEIMQRYERRMMSYVRKFLHNNDDVRDLVQDVFIKVYRNVQSFDSSKRFSPWIYRIAHNEMVNSLKRKVREPLNFFDPELLFPHPIAKEDPHDDAEKSEMRQLLNACLDELDEKYKEVLVLRYFEDMDYRDIAEILKVPVVTVGVRINRGKGRLKKIYEIRTSQAPVAH